MDIRKLHKAWELEAMIQLRIEVFVNEQQVDPNIEIDEYDQKPETQYIGAFEGSQLVGVLRVRPVGDDWKLQRIAVDKRYRSKKIGQRLIRFVITAAKNESVNRLYLHAQIQALGFYLKLGFQVEGEVFDEAAIPHQKVIYPLNEQRSCT